MSWACHRFSRLRDEPAGFAGQGTVEGREKTQEGYGMRGIKHLSIRVDDHDYCLEHNYHCRKYDHHRCG